MTPNKNNLKHMEWAIRSRYSNQLSSLQLLTLFENHEEIWKTQRFSKAAQDLIAAAFSLWRAAFLADKSGKRSAVFADGKKFLGNLIEDNSIAYVNDKNAREWTFNYYTRNARYALQILNEYWPDEVPKYKGEKRTATKRWDYCQQLLDEAVAGFKKLVEAKALQAEQVKRRRIARSESKRHRAKVRAMTLADRTK
jgi:hypothetical protein